MGKSNNKRRHIRLRLISGIIICLCLSYTAGFGFYGLREQLAAGPPSGPEDAAILWEAWRRVDRHFYGELPPVRTRTYGAIRASLELLDPYTVFVEPQHRELERDQLRGAYGGIGASVWRDAEGQLVLDPFPESPAERAGLRKGDLLSAIDGEPVSGETTMSHVEAQFHGEVGTKLTLTISRSPDFVLDIVITREAIERPSVTWRVLTASVGYIKVDQFTERTQSELVAALQSIEQVPSLVLDLRSNTGGLVESAVAVASLFLQKGDIVLSQNSRAGEQVFRAHSGHSVSQSLVVLVDAQTASAAEIVAGALQDHNRAILVGEVTFGKGSVQEIYDLRDGSSVHVTAAIWLTPSGHQINNRGLMPDIAVPTGAAQGDEQLDRAVAYLESES